MVQQSPRDDSRPVCCHVRPADKRTVVWCSSGKGRSDLLDITPNTWTIGSVLFTCGDIKIDECQLLFTAIVSSCTCVVPGLYKRLHD